MADVSSHVEAADLEGAPCLVCAAPMRRRVMPWSAQCPECGTWRSSLRPGIDSRELYEQIDGSDRIRGFKQLRDENNRRILDELETLIVVEGNSLLDVGSAHGWFVTAASERGFSAEGVEPDAEMVECARRQGVTVRPGYFPQAMGDGEQVDVISFNDVLEHIPDVDGALAACARVLRPGGVLSVNIPNASGLGYRVAVALARRGLRGPYLRLWQFGLPSPHIHYFNSAALERVIERHGFRVRRRLPLSSIRRSGLWARVHTVSKPTPLSVANFLALWLAAPMLDRPSQSDIVLTLAQRCGTTDGPAGA